MNSNLSLVGMLTDEKADRRERQQDVPESSPTLHCMLIGDREGQATNRKGADWKQILNKAKDFTGDFRQQFGAFKEWLEKVERPLPVGLVAKSVCALGETLQVGKKQKILPADWQWIPGGGSGVPASGFPKRIPAGGSAFQGGAVEFQWISSPRARDREAPGQALRPSPAPGQAPPDSELTSGEGSSRDWIYSNWSLKEWTSGEWNSSQSTSRAWQCPGITEARNPDPDPAAVPGAWAKALVAGFEGTDWGGLAASVGADASCQ